MSTVKSPPSLDPLQTVAEAPESRLSPQAQPLDHIPALDGLRGLAILMVLIHHFVMFAPAGPQSTLEKIIFSIGYTGWLGVDLFFVLSGFLITSILLRTKGTPHYFRRFIGRRALRIFPLYFVVLAIFFLFAPYLPMAANEVNDAVREQVWYWTYLYNFYVGLNGWSDSSLSHFWSLAVEEQFYLLWPVLVYRLSRPRLLALCAPLIPAAFVSRFFLQKAGLPVAANTFLWARMDSLLMGAVVALVDDRELSRLRPWLTALLGGAALGLLGLYVKQRGLFNGDALTLLWAPTFAGLLFAVIVCWASRQREGVLPRVLAQPWLRWVGKYSYGLYVLHRPAIDTVKWVLAGAVGTLPFYTTLTVLSLASLALTFALALVSWRIVEEPFLRLKRYL